MRSPWSVQGILTARESAARATDAELVQVVLPVELPARRLFGRAPTLMQSEQAARSATRALSSERAQIGRPRYGAASCRRAPWLFHASDDRSLLVRSMRVAAFLNRCGADRQ